MEVFKNSAKAVIALLCKKSASNAIKKNAFFYCSPMYFLEFCIGFATFFVLLFVFAVCILLYIRSRNRFISKNDLYH